MSEVQKFVCVSRYDATIVEGKIGKKFIMVGGDRFTKFESKIGEAVGRRSSHSGFYSSYLYPLDSEYAQKALQESQTRVRKQAIVNFVGKITDVNLINELYETYIKNSGGVK